MKFFMIISFFLLLNVVVKTAAQQRNTKVEYIKEFENTHHPEIAYWFFNKEMLNEASYKRKIDTLASFGKFTLLFITARNGVDFYDSKTMHPVFAKLVEYAHQKGLKIGLQLWEKRGNVSIENTERLIQEGEVVLDDNGFAEYTTLSRHARDIKLLIKSDLFKVLAFKKVSKGYYDATTLKDITYLCKAESDKKSVSVKINCGNDFKGYTAYILTQHYYNFTSNHSEAAKNNLIDILRAYSDIPFDGVGLDEYTNLRVSTTWELKKTNEIFRERSYSLSMASQFQKKTGEDLETILFNMRYAPEGIPAVRMKAINAYFDILRSGTMNIERIIYDSGKHFFGKNTFIGLHNTHHNYLDGDEIWQTGLNWWNVKRDYGQTDEKTPTVTQMGIGMSYPMNALYNMYYDKSLENIWTKALNDLRYGIRTHYHAINDVQHWGVSVESDSALIQISKVENAARLLNRFNPSFPKIHLLVVFGMEAQLNWYPDEQARNLNDINGGLDIEKKAKEIWDAGYPDALVPTDVIKDGRLTTGYDGKPVLQGHVFDAILFLYPQYAKESTLSFFENYVNRGGKLILEGDVTNGFDGTNIVNRWGAIKDRSFWGKNILGEIEKSGIPKNEIKDGVMNEDSSYTFTNVASFNSEKFAEFSFFQHGNQYTGRYKGLAAIKINADGTIQKLAATGFLELLKNGEVILNLNAPADLFLELKNSQYKIVIADTTGQVSILKNKL